MDPFRRNDTEITAKLFGQIFWRNEKRDVEDQMRLPRLTEIIHRLELSPVEMFSYKDRCRHWSAELDKSLKLRLRGDNPLEQKLSSQNATVRKPFERLRQICCHPQLEEDTVHIYYDECPNTRQEQTIVKRNKGQQTPVTVDVIYSFRWTIRLSELLTHLLQKVRKDCLVNYNCLTSALNSVGGLEILANKLSNAEKNYFRVLRLARDYQEIFNTDDIECLHAMTNLSHLIRTNHMETDMDSSLFNQDSIIELKEKLQSRHAISVSTTCSKILDLNSKILNNIETLELDWNRDDPMGSGTSKLLSQWWVKTLNGFLGTEHATEESFVRLVQHIKTSISIDNWGEFKLETTTHYNVDIFDTAVSLRDALERGILEIHINRTELMTCWTEIKSDDPNVTLEDSGSCHLGLMRKTLVNVNANQPQCRLCAFKKKLVNYESVIHREYLANAPPSRKKLPLRGNDNSDGQDIEKLHWNRDLNLKRYSDKSITEKILDEILAVAEKNCGLRHEFEEGEKHMELFKDMKDQCKNLRKWLITKEQEIIALNTMNEACTPWALALETSDHVPTTSTSTATATTKFVNRKSVKPSQLEGIVGQEQLKLKKTSITFNKSVAEYKFLKMLEKYEVGRIGYVNPDRCACSNELGQKWGFLPCSHCICGDCGDIQGLDTSVCMECEREFNFSEIRFVDTNSPRHTARVTNGCSWNLNSDEIWRDPVTKVEAIVRTLKTLQITHPNEKVLIVSSWDNMLEILKNEFHQNYIPFLTYKRGSVAESRKSLKNFRKCKNENSTQVLLMPLSVASTGLNLTEATHIFLVEPILNLSWEQQAIGRIHRLGQKRNTFVHRFYVAGTVEEKLHQRGQTNDVSEFEEGNLKVGDLKELLDNK